MRYLATHEQLPRGTFGFPMEMYYVDESHPRYEMPLHWHIECEFIQILKGSFSLTLDSGYKFLNAGDCAFIPSGVIHGGTPHDCIYQCLVVDMEHFLQVLPAGKTYLSELFGHDTYIVPWIEVSSSCWYLVQHLFEVVRDRAHGYELNAAGLLWQFMGEILRQHLYTKNTVTHSLHAKRALQLKKVLRRIRKDYASHLSLKDLAEEANMEAKYFCKIFRDVTGKTPFEYLNYYRIECAAELLCSSDDSVTAIAMACGFNDLTYFTRMFNRHKGINATEYRKNHSVTRGE